MGARRTAAAAASTLALAMVLGGCGDDGGQGGPSGAGTSSASPTETPTESPSSSASLPEPTPTPEPATGPRLDVSGVRVNAPKGWEQSFDSVVVDTAIGPAGKYNAGMALSVAATGGEQLSLRQAERYFWTRGQKPQAYQRQDTTVMGGVTAGYYTARDKYDDIHAVTLWDSNYVIKVEMGFDRRLPDDEQQELLQSVVASYSNPRMR